MDPKGYKYYLFGLAHYYMARGNKYMACIISLEIDRIAAGRN